jgi:3-oxoacyl-[acyl-carrier protein] reductase
VASGEEEEGAARRCLVTGANRGIGRIIAENLRVAGYDVIGLAHSRPADWVGDFVEADLAQEAALADVLTTVADLGQLWGLVNTAGVGGGGVIASFEHADFRQVFAVNAIAPAILVKACVPLMRSGGRIVNICSTAMRGKAERTAYGASKAALASMTRAWALELADRGILVNAINPGPVNAGMFRRHNPEGSTGEQRALAATPTHRITEPSEIADLAQFLLREKNRNLTGQVITIDGGST